MITNSPTFGLINWKETIRYASERFLDQDGIDRLYAAAQELGSKDGILNGLWYEFKEAISDCDWADADDLLNSIEERSERLAYISKLGGTGK